MKKNKTERLIDTKYNINSSQEDRDQYEDDVDEKKLRKTQQTFNSGNSKIGRNTFNSTFHSVNLNARAMGMSQYQSTNSLQNSVVSWTFGKNKRFNNFKQENYKLYNLSTSKNGRATTLGYGNKLDLLPLGGRGTPSPFNYNIKSLFDQNKADKKGIILGQKLKDLIVQGDDAPGVGTYNLPDPKKGIIPITVKSRQFFFYDKDMQEKKHCISPQKYHPNTTSQQIGRYGTIGFGYGTRGEYNSQISFPGPGAYNLPSIFDKTKRNKPALN